ncbi:HNH endonuclease [Hydrogenophaga crocea]|uniref:HNH endonuclease n=1 Tax=Hydrogenophaga crocea TaxID=2716225 RepID=A0A6G8ICM3_9BURK|nr:HNH endonuclease [Hydrogenophaga crocea]
MKPLSPLPEPANYLGRYVSIRDSKHHGTRGLLVANHALLTQRYQDHAQAVALGALESLQPNVQARQISEALRACYGGATQPLKELKRDIKAEQPERRLKYCPMCGTTLPKTFDHYLPAEKFPEFSVHPLNLVPCCSICNSIKNDDWLCAAGRRQYLHAYSDHLPDEPFIQVMLHKNPALKGVGATFALRRPAGMADALWQLIDSHFRKLNLIERYNERGNDEVSEILSDCRSYVAAGGQDARAFLSLQAADRAAVYGRNHWIAVLMEAVAAHADFDDWIAAN